MTTAREKAIERVADELHDATNAGALFDRIWFRVPFDVAQRHARELFDWLGLAAIDPALVEQVVSIERAVEAQGGWRGRDQAALVDAKIAIADAVLAQLRAGQ
jgi:hypothetical protein